jgi:AcrR family transcriptional regulator
MARWGGPGEAVPVRKRADARRNERTLLDAAGAVFVTYGVDAPVRQIAARAGLGMGTIYRHFPTRADLIVAVYEYQVDACVEAGPSLLETSDTPYLALTRWVDLFVDFVVTKHGLAEALQSERETFFALHDCLLDRLVPVLARLLEATSGSGEIRPGIDAFPLMRAIANLCIGGEDDPRYDAHEMAAFLVAGLRGAAPP